MKIITVCALFVCFFACKKIENEDFRSLQDVENARQLNEIILNDLIAENSIKLDNIIGKSLEKIFADLTSKGFNHKAKDLTLEIYGRHFLVMLSSDDKNKIEVFIDKEGNEPEWRDLMKH